MTHYALSASNCGESSMMIETDVIIVGAGISGLTAAYRLFRRDSSLRILVLEAKGWKLIAVDFSVAIELTVISTMKIILIICLIECISCW